jgi:hypothetical protein
MVLGYRGNYELAKNGWRQTRSQRPIEEAGSADPGRIESAAIFTPAKIPSEKAQSLEIRGELSIRASRAKRP